MSRIEKVDIKMPSFPLFGILAIVLTVLNLTGHIDISWWWVVAAFFGPLLIYVAVMLGFGVVGLSVVGLAFIGAFILDTINNIYRKFRRRRVMKSGRTRY